ncbi:hypothetical protein QBC47DRAFT_398084 [Echria macrotheca]|uniref:Uncharacterized protein n=1 Tax=Echria macrotheca TaxID=438768 RepID=A0AAJ0FDE8_9PEZI|nr:hypothetical protein QBC47DRAFT_398084 [Echria macrotheca]
MLGLMKRLFGKTLGTPLFWNFIFWSSAAALLEIGLIMWSYIPTLVLELVYTQDAMFRCK